MPFALSSWIMDAARDWISMRPEAAVEKKSRGSIIIYYYCVDPVDQKINNQYLFGIIRARAQLTKKLTNTTSMYPTGHWKLLSSFSLSLIVVCGCWLLMLFCLAGYVACFVLRAPSKIIPL